MFRADNVPVRPLGAAVGGGQDRFARVILGAGGYHPFGRCTLGGGVAWCTGSSWARRTGAGKDAGRSATFGIWGGTRGDLWGIALGLHGPFVEGLTIHLMARDGIELAGGTPGIVSYVVISAMLLVFTILCYTALSAMGAGARYLLGWMADR